MKVINKIKNKIPEEKRSKISNTINVLKIVKKVVSYILLAVLVFLVITFLLTRIMGGTPSLFGYTLHRVETGSMEPELMVGDVTLNSNVSTPDEIKVGDIITFQGDERFNNRKVTHRVLVEPYLDDQREWVLITRGDANKVDDGEIKYSSVESKVKRKVVFLSWIYNFFFSPIGLITFIVLLLVIFSDELFILVKSMTGNYDDGETENISEIIERIQKEDADKKAKEIKNDETERKTED